MYDAIDNFFSSLDRFSEFFWDTAREAREGLDRARNMVGEFDPSSLTSLTYDMMYAVNAGRSANDMNLIVNDHDACAEWIADNLGMVTDRLDDLIADS